MLGHDTSRVRTCAHKVKQILTEAILICRRNHLAIAPACLTESC